MGFVNRKGFKISGQMRVYTLSGTFLLTIMRSYIWLFDGQQI